MGERCVQATGFISTVLPLRQSPFARDPLPIWGQLTSRELSSNTVIKAATVNLAARKIYGYMPSQFIELAATALGASLSMRRNLLQTAIVKQVVGKMHRMRTSN